MRSDDEAVKSAADKLYKELTDAGFEVIYDDRPVSAGWMFSDADLLGVPVRVIISPKTLQRGMFELVTRDKTIKKDVAPENAVSDVAEIIAELTRLVNEKVPEAR